MKRSKILAIVLTAITVVSMLTSCSSSGSVTSEVSTEAVVSEDTIPTEVTEKVTVVSGSQFENPFDILDNPNVEQVELKGYLHVYTVLNSMGFTDIDLFKDTKKDTVRIGIVDDIAVGQFEVDNDNLVWNVRMEKADGIENRTGLEIPDDASVIPWSRDCFEACTYNWGPPPENGKAVGIELTIVYCPETNNLYSFYVKADWMANEKGEFENPSCRTPTDVVLTTEDKELKAKYGQDFFLNTVRVD